MYSIVLPRNVPSVYNNPDHNISCISDVPINAILVQNMLLTRPNPTYRHDCFDQELEIQGPTKDQDKHWGRRILASCTYRGGSWRLFA